MTQSPDTLVGQVVEDRYRIEDQLGAGGMGVVYRARHIKVGREVAIKVLHDHLLADATMVERFEREAEIAARLSHRNLISVIDVGETAGKQKLMVLELVRGESLATIVGRGPLSRARVIALVSQLLSGLEHAHTAGLVHRDLKPENVIVEVDDQGVEVPKIVDFGVALLRGEDKRLTTAGIVLGTPQYMAPEHAQGHAVDPRCDLFALGVMVYEMLGGKLPFDGTGVDVALANVTQDPPSILARTGVTVDPLLEAFARRLMARRVRDRFQSARAALDVLELVETHRDAAEELLLPVRARSETPRLRITALGTGAPVNVPGAPRVFAARSTQTPPIGTRRVFTARSLTDRTSEPLALATTLESWRGDSPTGKRAPASEPDAAVGAAPRRSRRRRPKKQPVPTKPWQPWKSFGLLAGAALAAITLGAIAGAGRLAGVESMPVPLAASAAAPIEQRIAIRTIARDSAPPRELASPRAAEPHRARSITVPRVAVAASAEQDAPRIDHGVEAPTATELATRYTEVGAALGKAKHANRDALWTAYRRIQLQQALTTPASRIAALRTLVEIQRGLR